MESRGFTPDRITYEVLDDGYMLYLDGEKWIHQFEPFIPNPDLTYEENAIAQIESLCGIATIPEV